jgi:D-aminopeptidase
MSWRVEIEERRLDAIFSRFDQYQHPGVAVGIALSGTPVYRRGFGLANMELPIALGPAMRMRIGSTSKHFTSLAYLLLCEEGKAEINDPVVKYLGDLNPVTHAITMRQLMGHLSGLRDSHELAWQLSGSHEAISSEELLALYRDIDDVNAAPETTWSYNNGGYLILSAVIERITGHPLEEVLRTRIFEPVGMCDTMLRRRENDFVPNSATLHAMNATGKYEKQYLGTALAGEGGIVSTVDDMLRWLAHMQAPKVGSAATWSTLKSPQKLRNGTSTGYGLGLINGKYRGVETLSHGGGVLGGNSQMLRVPAAAFDVVVTANRDDISSSSLANQILDACIVGLEPCGAVIDGPLAQGVFRSASSGRVIQLLEKEGGQIVSIDGFEWPFVRHPDGVLRPETIWSFVKQAVTLIGDGKRPAALKLDDFGNLDDFFAVQSSEGSDAKGMVGRYRSDSTRSEAEISSSGGVAHLTLHGPFGVVAYGLECLGDGLWLAKSGKAIPWNAVLSFDPVENGFRCSSLRTRGLFFRRVSRTLG